MALKKLVDEKARMTGWFEFVEGFEVQLAYMDRQTLREINRRCTKTIYRKHQPTEEVDSTMLNKEIGAHILGWRGLTKDILESMFPLKEGVELKGDLPCTDSDKLYLLEKAYGFDDFIVKSLTELEGYRREKLDKELKNSKALSQED